MVEHAEQLVKLVNTNAYALQDILEEIARQWSMCAKAVHVKTMAFAYKQFRTITLVSVNPDLVVWIVNTRWVLALLSLACLEALVLNVLSLMLACVHQGSTAPIVKTVSTFVRLIRAKMVANVQVQLRHQSSVNVIRAQRAHSVRS
jgi:hypothetical protein